MTMNKFLLFVFLLLSIVSTAQVEKAIPPRPSPPKLVNILSKNFPLTGPQQDGLERKLTAYDDSTSNQIAIVVVDDLGGYSAADFATELGRSWGVGNKDFNNGIVILLSVGNKPGQRDAFIAVGYGLEGVVTDLTAQTILDHDLIQNLKEGNYYRALDDATNSIIAAAAGRYQAPAGYGSRGKSKGLPPLAIIVIVIVLIVVFSNKGSGGGGYVSRRGYHGWGGPWIGGGFGGGGGGGFGGGGGGFGGFGGGSFGGGGAGGKW